MSWLLFFLLAALHPVVFVLIAWRSKTWGRRLLYWALLPIPAIVYCWDYWVIKNEHLQMCAAEGGLKVLTQPEKLDRVRLVGEIGRSLGKGLFQTYYPKLRVLESVTEDRDPKTGERLAHLDRHTASPNPREGMKMTKYPWIEPPYVIATERAESIERGMYEVSQEDIVSRYSKKTVLTLAREGRTYATHTEIVHVWDGIQYPDAVPTWMCPDTNTPLPPRGNASAPQSTLEYPKFGYEQILDLLF